MVLLGHFPERFPEGHILDFYMSREYLGIGAGVQLVPVQVCVCTLGALGMTPWVPTGSPGQPLLL